MKVIFDLDYTLLDTLKFKEKIAGIFDQEDFKADYKKYFKDEGINFDYDEYLAILKAEGRIDSEREKELRLELEKLISNINDYLKPDAENVLKHFKESGAELILVTFGNKKWQELKIKNLTIAKYFSNIIYEDKDKSKSEYLKSLSETDEEILLINDNLDEAKEMLKILKRGELHLVDGPYSKELHESEKKVRVKKLAELISDNSENKELHLK
ncbi:MAG: HAD hydrolase-like protein [Candidatus Falkowbacteria bacterium]